SGLLSGTTSPDTISLVWLRIVGTDYGNIRPLSATGDRARARAAGRDAARERVIASGRGAHVPARHDSGDGLRIPRPVIRRVGHCRGAGLARRADLHW